MNALTRSESTALTTMDDDELLHVLQTSLYPGANPASIRMVLGYCKASNLDPMQKPVHIVPMWDAKAKQMRDVTMPGIGLYRTQAARTGQLAGISEAEFGPMVTETLDGAQITYPEWARVVVKRILPSGHVAEFEAREFWVENYATAGRDTKAPNAMWKKRTRGQIAKCAEAQALRKGFPEVGSQPTADEMEGKSIGDDATPPPPPTIKHMGAAEVVHQEVVEPIADTRDTRPAFPQADFDNSLPIWKKASTKLPVADVLARAEAANPDFAFTEQQKAQILSLKAAEPVEMERA